MDDSLFEEEQRKIQQALNQAKKQELEKKYGAHFSQGASQLSPEIESQWLDNIAEFERQHKGARRITVREFLGGPMFRPIQEIPSEQLETEVDGIMDLLALHNISVDCLADVSNEDLYRFLTKELMDEEVDDVRIPGMRQCFIYEEFHPNDEYDARTCAESFLWDLFERHTEYLISEFAKDEIYDPSGRRVTPEEMSKLIHSFYSRYTAITDHRFEFISCLLEGEYATVILLGKWSGLRTGSMETVSHSGRSELRMKKSPYGGYDVVRVNIPGLM